MQAITTALLLVLAGQTEWNQFQGPGGQGKAPAANLPEKWSETLNHAWGVNIPGKAWASPIVHQGKIWLANSTEDGKRLSLLGLDLTTGKQIHDITVFEVPKPAFCFPYNSYASSTPTAKDGKVFVHYGSAGTACINAQNGNILWKRNDLPCDHHRGAGSSPLLWNDRLYLIFDGFDKQYVACLNATDGSTLWKTDRGFDYGTDNGDSKKAYATPAIVEAGGSTQVVCPSASHTAAYDALTGKEVWRVKHGGMNAASIPQRKGDSLFLASSDGGWGLGAVRLGATGKLPEDAILWKTAKGAPQYSSLVIDGDLIYSATEKGFACCLEAATGAEVYQERLGNKFHASPVLSGDKLWLFDDKGKGYCIRAGRKYQLLGSGQLDDGCMATPAIAGDILIVRTRKGLHALKVGG